MSYTGSKDYRRLAPNEKDKHSRCETFVAAIQDEISRTRDGRYFHRLDVILYVLQGASPYDAARLSGHSPRTIEYWVHRLLSDGLAGLWEGNRSGRPGRLSATDLQKLRNELRRSPRELGYGQNLWDGVLLSHHLAKEYSTSLSVRQCQRLFHVLDNARWQKARALRELFYVNRNRIVRIFLPPYSPELNPVERVWRITRRQVTPNRYFQSNEDL